MINFEVVGIIHAIKGCATIEGRLHEGSLHKGDIFTHIMISELQSIPVFLQVIDIIAYRKSLDMLGEGWSAVLIVTGEKGINELKTHKLPVSICGKSTP